MLIQFKLFIRNLKRNRVLSVINIFGLVLGMLSTVLILEYVAYEKSYDSHHKNADNVYRIAYDRYKNGELMWETSYSFAPMPYYLKDNFEEVVNSFQMRRNYNANFSYLDANNQLINFNEEKTYFSTGSIFEVLSIPLLQGDKNCLDEPGTIAISQRAAEKYFGSENPIGKQLRLNFREPYTVTAIFETFPHNTHFRTDFILTLRNMYDRNPDLINNWNREGFYNYIQLRPDTDPEAFFNKAFPLMIKEHKEDWLSSRSMSDIYYLQRLSDIHLNSNIENEMEIPGSKTAVKVLFVFSIFFIIIAWINYINLISARAVERAKEVGVKKICGSSKFALTLQFMVETLWFNALTLGITIALFFLINPYFKDLTKIGDFNMFTFKNYTWYFLLFLMVGIGMSGLYSAFVLTAIQPVQIIKGKYIKTRSALLFRKGLVTFQFAVSLVLFIGTIVTFIQLNHLMEQEIGVNYSQKLAIKSPRPAGDNNEHYQKLEVFKQKIKTLPSVLDACIMSDVFGHEVQNGFGGYKKGANQADMTAHFRINADNNFIDFLEIRLIAGENYRETDLPESNKIILTESSMRRFGFTDPHKAVGQTIVRHNNQEYQIIGITENFQYKSVKVESVPYVISNFNEAKNYLVLSTRLMDNSTQKQLLEECESIYARLFSDAPFEYHFLEDNMANDLKPDRTFVQVFSLFSVQAIIIAVLGVLGLLIIMINQTMKQIGVRKVLGAQQGNIFRILAQTLLPEFALGMLIGLPTAFYIFNNLFLNAYVHRISLQWYYFIVPVFSLLILFGAIVMVQSTRAYQASVVSVLHEE